MIREKLLRFKIEININKKEVKEEVSENIKKEIIYIKEVIGHKKKN